VTEDNVLSRSQVSRQFPLLIRYNSIFLEVIIKLTCFTNYNSFAAFGGCTFVPIRKNNRAVRDQPFIGARVGRIPAQEADYTDIQPMTGDLS
jgi:hypothetical protein